MTSRGSTTFTSRVLRNASSTELATRNPSLTASAIRRVSLYAVRWMWACRKLFSRLTIRSLVHSFLKTKGSTETLPAPTSELPMTMPALRPESISQISLEMIFKYMFVSSSTKSYKPRTEERIQVRKADADQCVDPVAQRLLGIE